VNAIENILPRLRGVRAVGKDRWTAVCPVHEETPDGHRRSLSITRKPNGDVLLFCHGCGRDATPGILAMIGLGFADLFTTKRAGRNRRP
jgi:hypothetical protein